MKTQQKLLITVTTADKDNTFTVPADWTNVQIKEEVRRRFGAQAVGLDHSYCGVIAPE